MISECVGEAWRAGWTPDPLLMVSEWADEHRKLGSKSSAEPGDWDTNRVPYAREPMDRLSVTDPTEMVVLMWGAQTSKTETGNNWTGYVVHHAPGPMMLVQPTVDMAKRLSKQRLADMIEQTPALRDRIAESRSRDSGNTLLSKEFPGGVLVLAGANSASGLRSMPARYLFLDEVDAYPLDVDDEGDPVSLAIKRTTTFGRRRKVLITSTPTVKDASRIEKAYEASDKRRYFVPCPHCGHMQWLRWRGYADDTANDPRAREYRLVWLDEAKTAAGFKCGADDCGALIEEHHKTKMLLAGEWRATATGDGKTKGYQLSSLYSPLGWLSWVELLQEFEAAATDPAQLKTFVNTRLAETWEDANTQRLDKAGLQARAGGYLLGQVPHGGLVLTAGIDMQRRGGGYAQMIVRAWGPGDESWLVDRKIIHGDQFGAELWEQLDAALGTKYRHASGVDLPIYAAAIDAGDGETTHEVYAWARKHRKRHVIATKGKSTPGGPILGTPSKQDINARRVKVKRGVESWPLGSDTAKSTLHGRLRIDGEQGAGVVHWPDGLPDDYWAQLTSERQVVELVNGFPRRKWVKKDGDYNEDLDCEVLAMASLEYVKTRFNRATMWAQLANRLQTAAGLPDADAGQVESVPDAPAAEAAVGTADQPFPAAGRVSLTGWSRR